MHIISHLVNKVAEANYKNPRKFRAINDKYWCLSELEISASENDRHIKDFDSCRDNAATDIRQIIYLQVGVANCEINVNQAVIDCYSFLSANWRSE